MKRKFQAILCIIIAFVMVAGFSACGNTAAGDKAAVAAPSDTTAAAPKADDTKKAEKTTLKVWTLWTESVEDVNKKAFYRVLDNAKKDMPDITIEHDATENEAYKTKIKTAIAANEAPDIFYSWGAGFVKPFVDAGKVLPLDDYLNDGTRDKMNAGSATFFTFDGKTYGLPAYQWVAVLYCNKELFEKNNIKMPDTFDELLTAVKAFRAKGISPITVGEKDRWPGMFFQNAFALRAAGAQVCQDALAKKASFDQPAFVESAEKLKELVDAKAFIDGNMGLTVDESQAPFLEGKIPMYYMGNWFAGNIVSKDSKVADKITCKKFPSLSDGKGNMDEFLGGSIEAFCVNNDTKYKDAAVKTVKYFAEGMAKDLAQTGDGLPTWKVPAATGEINPITKQIMDMTKDSKGFVLAWDTFLEGADADTHKNLVADVFGGKLTPENFAKEMQKLNDKK
jgi:raffinose/stachyose/melibiose transport system substrate-binding protein